MKIAGRFRLCVHMGCFDLETFVEMQQRSRKASRSVSKSSFVFVFGCMRTYLMTSFFSSLLQWQCPICLKNYSLESIIIDPYFNRIANMVVSTIDLSRYLILGSC